MSKTQTQVDRRILRTRTFITETFEDLLAKEPFEEITVSEICEGAMINRSTFYSHYIDKYDLFSQYIDHEIEEVETILHEVSFKFIEGNQEQTPDPCFLELLKHINEHHERYELLLYKVDKEHFFKPFCRLVEKSVINYLGESSYDDVPFNDATKFLKCYLTNSIIDMIKTWMDYSQQYTPHYWALQYTKILHLHLNPTEAVKTA